MMGHFLYKLTHRSEKNNPHAWETSSSYTNDSLFVFTVSKIITPMAYNMFYEERKKKDPGFIWSPGTDRAASFRQ